jgi:hypothetical protein
MPAVQLNELSVEQLSAVNLIPPPSPDNTNSQHTLSNLYETTRLHVLEGIIL